jgi:hypothetical protein
MKAPVVSNTSSIIALDRVGQLGLLHDLYSTIVVPPAVVREAQVRLELPSWIVEMPLAQPVGARILRASLGPGESEAIALALECEARLLILDDWAARRLAQTIGLHVAGTLALLVHAKRRGLLSEVKPVLDALIAQGFRASDTLRERVLLSAGESVS